MLFIKLFAGSDAGETSTYRDTGIVYKLSHESMSHVKEAAVDLIDEFPVIVVYYEDGIALAAGEVDRRTHGINWLYCDDIADELRRV